MRALARLLILLTVALLAAGPSLQAVALRSHAPSIASPAAPQSPAARVVEFLAYGLAVFGAIRIKDTGTLATKFVQRAGAAAGDYKDGVQQAGPDWETNTKNSEPSYEQGVQQSISDKRFGKGVAAAGAAKYVKNASELGSVRYQPGVANAKDAWARGTQPYLDRLKSLELPPPGPRRSPQNQQRANAVALALGAMKVGK